MTGKKFIFHREIVKFFYTQLERKTNEWVEADGLSKEIVNLKIKGRKF